MSCACIRDSFDFSLIQDHCGRISYIDRSTYQYGFTGTPTYELTITNPGGFKQTYQVTKGIPLHLDFGPCPKADVYLFEVTTCGEPFSKNYPILCTLECGRIKATAKLGKGVDLPTLRSIREDIEFIKESVGFGDIVTARELIQVVQRTLDKLLCSCDCF